MTGPDVSSVTEDDLRERFEAADYVADDTLVTTVYLSLRLGKPLLIEGEPGSGKTELGKVLAESFETELIRLQCYEGLAAENTLYEWNYTKQLLAVQSGDSAEAGVFSEEYLFERPLLRALTHEGEAPPVLLIDEVDRADEEFEAFLLEVLSDFQVTIPEFGTVTAETPPIVIITSNRTRGLSDALKRRCLYLHVDAPSYETEREIVRRKVPQLDATVAAEVCAIVAELRENAFLKRPGVAETLDWARAVAELRAPGDDSDISAAEIERTIGTLLKEVEDVQRVDSTLLERLERAAREAREATDGDETPTAGTESPVEPSADGTSDR
ncbi:AAA family ATPase [Salinigranum halophilum]|jgi:MoxR-like ATPase|uniref:AAA family ATPase n=1 Tax=Salinigranum halophilum TaxID=2565931 RepID=UPI0010A81A12|nr:MoxR family ATPase [Salinigranum halophilum]